MEDPQVTLRPVTKVAGRSFTRAEDALAVERALEIRAGGRPLAVELAEAAGMTMVGFLREGRMNVYCGEERIG